MFCSCLTVQVLAIVDNCCIIPLCVNCLGVITYCNHPIFSENLVYSVPQEVELQDFAGVTGSIPIVSSEATNVTSQPIKESRPSKKKSSTNNVQGIKYFSCCTCSRKFNTNYSLKCHMRIHSGETPYHCPMADCSRKFRRGGDLAKHIRTHTGERPFECEVCGQCFTTSNILRVHTRKHTGERPFACTYTDCDKRFSSKTNLQNHLRMHTGEKPYVCVVEGCGRGFTEYSSWYKHQVVHEEGSKYLCNLCSKSYRHLSTLKHHLRSVHSQTLEKNSAIMMPTGAAPKGRLQEEFKFDMACTAEEESPSVMATVPTTLEIDQSRILFTSGQQWEQVIRLMGEIIMPSIC